MFFFFNLKKKTEERMIEKKCMYIVKKYQKWDLSIIYFFGLVLDLISDNNFKGSKRKKI